MYITIHLVTFHLSSTGVSCLPKLGLRILLRRPGCLEWCQAWTPWWWWLLGTALPSCWWTREGPLLGVARFLTHNAFQTFISLNFLKMHLPRGVSEVTFLNLIAHTLLSKLWTGVRHSHSFLEIATANFGCTAAIGGCSGSTCQTTWPVTWEIYNVYNIYIYL